jgi:hypothetical protein
MSTYGKGTWQANLGSVSHASGVTVAERASNYVGIGLDVAKKRKFCTASRNPFAPGTVVTQFFFLLVVKGPAIDATDALQP